uniref:Uncharacterized protein n=1 Tax=Globisporangium ultimum (strain ATCC 200006 / CBS 805.95 / DAOM BR144) TaxID=431595 RepID=K3WUW4_GLOUD
MDDAREATAAASGKKTLPDALDVVSQSASSPLAKNLLQMKRTTRRSASVSGESGDEGVAPDDCNTGAQGLAHDSIESQNEPVMAPVDDATTAVEERDQARGDKMRSTAVVAVMQNGGSAAAAAARFESQRSEVTRILKHAADSVEVSAASSTMTTAAADASDSETTEDDGKHAAICASASESAEPQVGKKRKATADTNDQDPYASSDASTTTAVDANLLTPVKATSAESLLHTSHATDSSGSSSKAKRVRKSKEEKLAILHFVEQGGTHVAAAERFGISRTAVTKMVKEREAIWTKATRTASGAAGEAKP